MVFFTEIFFWKDSTNFRHWKMTLEIRILISLTRLFIILVWRCNYLVCLFPINALVWCPTWSKNLGPSLVRWVFKQQFVLSFLKREGRTMTAKSYLQSASCATQTMDTQWQLYFLISQIFWLLEQVGRIGFEVF